MPPADPITLSWTFRLKCYKTTVLLHVDPLQSLGALKEDLIQALQALQTPLDHLESLPVSPAQIQLAKPRDTLDSAAGWERIDVSDDFLDDVDELAADEDQVTSSKGKGKRKANGARQVNRHDGDERTIKECGLKDNAVIAFGVRAGSVDDELEMVLDRKEIWNVVIPTYEDTYGVENEGDLGQLKEYRG